MLLTYYKLGVIRKPDMMKTEKRHKFLLLTPQTRENRPEKLLWSPYCLLFFNFVQGFSLTSLPR